MMAIHLPIFLSMFVVFCAGSPAIKQPPVWRNVYTVKGVINVPHSEIEEPFHGWYNGPGQKSRIDFYGGTTKTYQLGNESPYGRSLKLVPVTNESEMNKITCFQMDGTGKAPQPILPDLTGFTPIGEETIDSVVTEKWQLIQTIGQKTNKYAMWLYYKVDPDNKNSKIPVPVKYARRSYSSLSAYYDHYYLEYSDYDVNDIDSEIFKIPDNMTCSSFQYRVDEVSFNPMKEFIHPTTSSHVDFEFDKFTKKHGKNYSTDREQEDRKNIFMHNLRYIHSINRQNLGYSLAVNHLADMTDSELKALRGRLYSGGYNGGSEFPYRNFDKWELPDQFDWRLYGAVTPVKDQSQCGSCWAFGTVGAIEGAYFLKTRGQLKRLSQQALIDCSWGYDNLGCDGGEDFQAYKWMLKHGGIPTEDDYGPYLAQDGYCHADEVPKVAKITGYVNVTQNNQNALKLAIFKHGPISVAIDASQNTFHFYSHGVYYEEKCDSNKLDHAVLAVGYGTMDGEDFWLIKNSWSDYWGNDGYILMSIKDNNCGVMTIPTYVTM